MEQKDMNAELTKKREVSEDAHELIAQVISRMWISGQLDILVIPIIAVVDPTGTTVLLSDGRKLTIPHDAPYRARLE